MKKWELRRRDKDRSEILQSEFNISKITADILAARGIVEKEKVEKFISGESAFSDAMLMKDMDKAVARIEKAVENGEKICVYGDYDCDGITATVLLYSYFEDSGVDVCYYIPDREKEGYGLNARAISAIKKFGVNLIITVDNGISAYDEVKYSNELGIDVIITDHHKPKGRLPEAVAVIDSHREDGDGTLRELAGVGVVFKLVSALEGDDGSETLERYGDIAVIGTVADIVPLTGENRIIVKKGIEILKNSEKPGIRALIKVAGLSDKNITSESIGFGIGPRINSASRMDDPKKAVNLLLSEDYDEALTLAEELDRLNAQRKEEEKKIMDSVEKKICEDRSLLDKRVVVISGENWHNGVIGIAAAKILEKYGKPCVLISINGDEARGSARSLEGFSMIDAIAESSELLTRFGGHAGAAGMTLPSDSVEEFDEKLQKTAREKYETMPVYTLKIDRILTIPEITVREIERFGILEPFGCGNESPIFAIRKLAIEGIYPIGDNKHIRIKFSRDGMSLVAVYFGVTPSDFAYSVGETVDIAVDCGINEYNGEKKPNIKIIDIRLSDFRQESLFCGKAAYDAYARGEGLDEENMPTRDDFISVYRYLKANGGYSFGYDRLNEKLSVADGGMNYCKLRLILDMLESENLIKAEKESGKEKIKLENFEGKIDLFGTEKYKEIENSLKIKS